MNKEIEERLVSLIRSLFESYDVALKTYATAHSKDDKETMLDATECAEMLLNEISYLYYVVTGKHTNVFTIKKTLNII